MIFDDMRDPPAGRLPAVLTASWQSECQPIEQMMRCDADDHDLTERDTLPSWRARRVAPAN